MNPQQQRLDALNRTTDDLFAEAENTGDKPSVILTRWEDESTPIEARSLRFINEHCHLTIDDDPKRIGLTAVRRLNTTPVLWEIVGDLGTTVATTTQLAELRHMKGRIVDVTGRVPTLVKGFKWDVIFQAFVNAATNVDVGDLGTDAGQLREWLNTYFDFATVYPDLDSLKKDGNGTYDAYADGPDVMVFATRLRAHIERPPSGDKITNKELAVQMRALLGEPAKPHITRNGRDTTANAYRVPPAVHGLGTDPGAERRP